MKDTKVHVGERALTFIFVFPHVDGIGWCDNCRQDGEKNPSCKTLSLFNYNTII